MLSLKYVEKWCRGCPNLLYDLSYASLLADNPITNKLLVSFIRYAMLKVSILEAKRYLRVAFRKHELIL